MIFPHTGWFVVILLIRGIVAFFAIKGWYTILCSGIHPACLCFHSCRMFFCLSRPSCSCFICTPHGIQCGCLVGLVLACGQQYASQCHNDNVLCFHAHHHSFMSKMQCFLQKRIMVDPHPWGEWAYQSFTFYLSSTSWSCRYFFVSHFYMRLL